MGIKSITIHEGQPEICYTINLNPVVYLSSYEHENYHSFNLWLGLGYVSFAHVALLNDKLSTLLFNFFNLSWTWDNHRRRLKRIKGGD